MNLKLFFSGIALFIIGLLMYFNVRKRKPASDKTNWNGQLSPQYIQFWIMAIIGIIVGLVFILKSLFH
jgi:heme/copper-type cytochrome/quinol oxidase subunit 2